MNWVIGEFLHIMRRGKNFIVVPVVWLLSHIFHIILVKCLFYCIGILSYYKDGNHILT